MILSSYGRASIPTSPDCGLENEEVRFWDLESVEVRREAVVGAGDTKGWEHVWIHGTSKKMQIKEIFQQTLVILKFNL